MAISNVLLIPDKVKDKFLPNILDLLKNVELGKERADVNRLVLSMNAESIKAFYMLNAFANTFNYAGVVDGNMYVLNKNSVVSNLIIEVTDTGNRLLGLKLRIDSNFETNIIPDLEKGIMSFLSSNVNDKELFKADKFVNINFGLLLSGFILSRIGRNAFGEDLIVDNYKLPYGDGTLLITVVNQDMYTKIINTLYKVSKDFLEINENTLSKPISRDAIHTPIKLIVEDFVKEQISKEPGIGYTVIDNFESHRNKSFAILPRARY